jgi:hypothetical protein
MKRSIPIRTIIDIVSFIAISQGWWFAALPLGLIGAWKFPFYIELVIMGVAYDALFGFAHGLGWMGYLGTFVSTFAMFLVLTLKKIVR